MKAETASRRSLTAAVVAAVVASICCVGPFLLLALGVGGAWIGSLTALEPYRPFFMVATVFFLAYAFYRVYRQPRTEECEPGSFCANPRSVRLNKILLWMVTGLVAILFAVPYVASGFSTWKVESAQVMGTADSTGCADCALPAVTTDFREAVLEVANLTCATCQVAVQKGLSQLEGVVQVQVNLEDHRAVVTYDPKKVDPLRLEEAATRIGFPSRLLAK